MRFKLYGVDRGKEFALPGGSDDYRSALRKAVSATLSLGQDEVRVKLDNEVVASCALQRSNIGKRGGKFYAFCHGWKPKKRTRR